jgi:hypothetical protein
MIQNKEARQTQIWVSFLLAFLTATDLSPKSEKMKDLK